MAIPSILIITNGGFQTAQSISKAFKDFEQHAENNTFAIYADAAFCQKLDKQNKAALKHHTPVFWDFYNAKNKTTKLTLVEIEPREPKDIAHKHADLDFDTCSSLIDTLNGISKNRSGHLSISLSHKED